MCCLLREGLDDLALLLPVDRNRVALKPDQRESPGLATCEQLFDDVGGQQGQAQQVIDGGVAQSSPSGRHCAAVAAGSAIAARSQVFV